MLRIFLWRFYFESLNLLKILGYRGRTVLYFAFGANLDPAVLDRRKMTILGEESFTLHGYKLVFDQQGPFEGGGFASIVESPGSVAFGKLYKMTRVDERRMDCYEAMPFLKRHRKVRLILPPGEVYFYQSNAPRAGLVPTLAYFQKILTCYEATPDFPIAFLEEFRKTEILKEEVPLKNIRFLIREPEKYGSLLRPCLEFYDKLCFSLFLKIIYRPSIFDKYIPR